eukprot:gb/GECH01009398.1/.p1 GENE.gb/GECH01009398.1/~~gb/GECH01009398.1/.p1  ORF type:complete len:553 (+),score=107.05 gb/GECH01009398.1/:1-1659(+)
MNNNEKHESHLEREHRTIVTEYRILNMMDRVCDDVLELIEKKGGIKLSDQETSYTEELNLVDEFNINTNTNNSNSNQLVNSAKNNSSRNIGYSDENYIMNNSINKTNSSSKENTNNINDTEEMDEAICIDELFNSDEESHMAENQTHSSHNQEESPFNSQQSSTLSSISGKNDHETPSISSLSSSVSELKQNTVKHKKTNSIEDPYGIFKFIPWHKPSERSSSNPISSFPWFPASMSSNTALLYSPNPKGSTPYFPFSPEKERRVQDLMEVEDMLAQLAVTLTAQYAEHIDPVELMRSQRSMDNQALKTASNISSNWNDSIQAAIGERISLAEDESSRGGFKQLEHDGDGSLYSTLFVSESFPSLRRPYLPLWLRRMIWRHYGSRGLSSRLSYPANNPDSARHQECTTDNSDQCSVIVIGSDDSEPGTDDTTPVIQENSDISPEKKKTLDSYIHQLESDSRPRIIHVPFSDSEIKLLQQFMSELNVDEQRYSRLLPGRNGDDLYWYFSDVDSSDDDSDHSNNTESCDNDYTNYNDYNNLMSIDNCILYFNGC